MTSAAILNSCKNPPDEIWYRNTDPPVYACEYAHNARTGGFCNYGNLMRPDKGHPEGGSRFPGGRENGLHHALQVGNDRF